MKMKVELIKMTNYPKIYLASKSPRRRELLSQMGVDYELLLFDIPEVVLLNESPFEYSKRITYEKMSHAWDKLIFENLSLHPVLCADTEVVLEGKILGKANSYDEAFAMLKSYSNKSHEVITTVGIKFADFTAIRTNTTIVSFANIPNDEIHKYLVSGDYKDKSGSYGIQSYIGQFITGINGCFYSVIGLPLNSVRNLLLELNSVLAR